LILTVEVALTVSSLNTGLKEEYDPDLDGKTLRSQAIGVPGAAMPSEMTGHKPSFAPGGPTPMRKSGAPGTGDEVVDAGEVLSGYGLQGVEITMNELTQLAKDLGLDEKNAADLAKGLKPSDLKKDKPVEEEEKKGLDASEQSKDPAEPAKTEDKAETNEEPADPESKTKETASEA
jgi:SH3 domain-binding glutamic acid-rich protein